MGSQSVDRIRTTHCEDEGEGEGEGEGKGSAHQVCAVSEAEEQKRLPVGRRAQLRWGCRRGNKSSGYRMWLE